MFAHFLYLRERLRSVRHLNFFLDQESGIRAAVMTAFRKEIPSGAVTAFFVRSKKGLTVDQRKRALAEAELHVKKLSETFPTLKRHEVGVAWLTQQLKVGMAMHGSSMPWITHPFPDAAEPHKEICLLTAVPGADPHRLGQAALYAGLRSIDKFFMMIRRRISLLERPIHTPASDSRSWHGYSPYNPVVACQLLNVFRVAYNYHLQGADKRTPAMRLGLCDRPYSLEELLSMPRPHPRFKSGKR